MFRKQAVRTYERKKAGTHSAASVARTIIREDVPPDRDMQPEEFVAFKDTDEIMTYDPFDTTFDRLLKTAVMPPKPPREESDLSYDSSSSNGEVKIVHSDMESPIPLALTEDEPVAKKRRTYKRKKVAKKIEDPDLTLVTGRLTKLSKRLGRLNKSSSIGDENTEPNVEKSAVGNKRGKNNADKLEEETVKRHRVSEKRTSITVYRRRKQSLNNSKNLMRCSVILTKLDLPSDASTAVSITQNEVSGDTTRESEEFAIPGSSKTGEEFAIPGTSKSGEGFAIPGPSKTVEEFAIPGTSKTGEEFAIPGPSKTGEEFAIPGSSKTDEEFAISGISKTGEEFDIPGTSKTGEEFAIPGPSKTGEEFAIPGPSKTGEEFAIPGSSKTGEEFAIPGPSKTSEEFAIPGPSKTGEEFAIPGPSKTGEEFAIPEPSKAGNKVDIPGPSKAGEKFAIPELSKTGKEVAIPGPSEAGEKLAISGRSKTGEKLAIPKPSKAGKKLAIPGPSKAGKELAIPQLSKAVEELAIPELSKAVEELAVPGPSKVGDDHKDRFTMEQDASTEEFTKKPEIIMDTVTTPSVKTQLATFKNPIVSLNRLKVPQRFSIANKNWISSTPIGRRTTIKTKTLLRFSPIDGNESIKMKVRHGDENSGEASFPPEAPVHEVESVPVKSTMPKLSQRFSENLAKKSARRRAIALSDSPSVEPSCLIFDDTETPEVQSLSNAAAKGDSYTSLSHTEKAKCKDTTDASTTSDFQGFSVEPSDPESLKLQYEATDHNTASSSENLVQSVEKTKPASPAEEKPSLVAEENDKDTTEVSSTTELTEITKDYSDAESLHLSLNDDEKEESSSKEFHHSVEDTNSASVDDTYSAQDQAAPSDNLVDNTEASANEQFSGMFDSSKNSSQDNTKNTSEKFDSDDEWTTIQGSSEAEADISNKKEIPVKNSSETSEPYRRESIEQLSSDDDNTSSVDIVELVNTNESSSNHMGVEVASKEEIHSENEESVRIEDTNVNESKVEEPSVVELANEDSKKVIRHDLDKSIVLLERLVLPVGKAKRVTNVKNTRMQNTSETVKSSKNSTVISKGNVFGIDTAIPRRKSRRLTDIDKTGLKNPPDNVNLSKNLTLSSDDGNISGINKPVPAKKSRRITSAEKTKSINPSDTMDSSQNSILSSADSNVSDIETPVVKKSERITKVQSTSVKNLSVAMDSSQNSTLDSADSDVSDIETPVVVKKSGKITKVQETSVKNLSDTMDSSQNSTLSSADSIVSDIETPVVAKKSERITKVQKTSVKNLSVAMDSSQNSTLSSADSNVSDIETPVVKKPGKITKVQKTSVKNLSDTMDSSQNSTLSSADSNVFYIETPVAGKKSRRITKVEKTREKDRSDTLESSQDSTSSSDDDSVSSIDTPVSVKNSREITTVESTRVNNSSDTLESNKNSTLNSNDSSVSSTDTPPFRSKTIRLTHREKTQLKNAFDALDSSGNSPSRHTEMETTNEESQVSMDSSVVEEVIENATETDELSKMEVSERDLNKASCSYSMTEVINTSPASSTKMDVEDSQTEELQKIDDSPEVTEKKSPSEISSVVEIRENDSYENTRLSSVQPVVLLTRLNDPVRVSLRRRKKYSNLNFQLSGIAENGRKTATIIEETPQEIETPESYQSAEIIDQFPGKLSGEVIDSQPTTSSCGTSTSLNTINESRFAGKEDKLLFLKSGKSWARSLSILSNVHSQEDLESLAVGKGKKWRESANYILQMQQQGLLQSCVKKNEDDKESRSFYGVRNSTAAAWIPESSQSDTSRVFGSASPGRFVRRVSIRVVPDSENLDDIEDTPFLEAYGITSSQNRETLTKRSSSIAPRKTLVYNVQNVSYDNTLKSPNSEKSRDVVLAQCCQEGSLSFNECYPLSYLNHCRKIGEGVYGEVFLYEKGTKKNVIKIIPIEGEMNVNNERQKKFDEILSEIVIAKQLHNLRFADSSRTNSFVEVKNIRCVTGKYPRKLIDLWKTYDEEKNSENDCPEMFDNNQLYIVLELGHGGQDLEAFVFQNASESHALFMQAAAALAVAEEELDFEHRDLHWGNILIARTGESHVEYKLRGKTIRLASKGVKVSVIDFTLSRMSYQGCSIFNDLSMDEDLFAAQGEYQFEIYRLMRKEVQNDWKRFEPFTNILWLHYTLDKMITAVRYRRKNSKIHNNSIEKLRKLKDTLLDYKSAFDFVTKCDKAT